MFTPQSNNSLTPMIRAEIDVIVPEKEVHITLTGFPSGNVMKAVCTLPEDFNPQTVLRGTLSTQAQIDSEWTLEPLPQEERFANALIDNLLDRFVVLRARPSGEVPVAPIPRPNPFRNAAALSKAFSLN